MIYYIKDLSCLKPNWQLERYELIWNKYHDSREMTLSYIFATSLSSYIGLWGGYAKNSVFKKEDHAITLLRSEKRPDFKYTLKRCYKHGPRTESEFMHWIQLLADSCYENRSRRGFFLSGWKGWLVFFAMLSVVVVVCFFILCTESFEE